MCCIGFFEEKRIGRDDEIQRRDTREFERKEKTRDITTIINNLYDELLKFDLTYEQLYKMTVKELIKTLEQRRKGLAYKMWKSANLFGAGVGSNNYPSSPEEACPELCPPKVSIKMPDFLKEKWLKRGGK